jgi:hypothetical protein
MAGDLDLDALVRACADDVEVWLPPRATRALLDRLLATEARIAELEAERTRAWDCHEDAIDRAQAHHDLLSAVADAARVVLMTAQPVTGEAVETVGGTALHSLRKRLAALDAAKDGGGA